MFFRKLTRKNRRSFELCRMGSRQGRLWSCEPGLGLDRNEGRLELSSICRVRRAGTFRKVNARVWARTVEFCPVSSLVCTEGARNISQLRPLSPPNRPQSVNSFKQSPIFLGWQELFGRGSRELIEGSRANREITQPPKYPGLYFAEYD